MPGGRLDSVMRQFAGIVKPPNQRAKPEVSRDYGNESRTKVCAVDASPSSFRAMFGQLRLGSKLGSDQCSKQLLARRCRVGRRNENSRCSDWPRRDFYLDQLRTHLDADERADTALVFRRLISRWDQTGCDAQ